MGRGPGGDGEAGRLAPTALREGFGDGALGVVDGIRGDQGDARPTEAPTGHPRAEGTGRPGPLDRHVELVAAHLVVVAQRGVRGVEEPPHLGQVTGTQCLDGGPNPSDLGDDVARSAPLAARATRAEVGRSASYAQRWSDHAPVTVTYDL